MVDRVHEGGSEVVSQVVVRQAARLLLLAVLALGVLGMHTLGHPSDEHGADTAMASVEALPHGATHAAVAATASHGLAIAGETAVMNPMNVCLAILTAFAIASLLAVLLANRDRRISVATTYCPSWTVGGRGPPLPVAPLGRRLAALSVLRT